MRVAGNISPVEILPPIEGWDPQRGKTQTRRWTGPAALVEAKKLALQSSKTPYNTEQQPGKFGIISATYSGVDQPSNVPLSDQWTMVPNDLEKDIWELPAIVAEIAKTLVAHTPLSAKECAYAGAQAIKDIKALIAGEKVQTEGGVAVTMDAALAACAVAGMNVNVVWAFVQDLLKGAKTFTIDQYVLRRVRTVPENTAIKAVESLNSRVGWMFSKTSLISLEKAPSTLPVFGPLPDGYYLKRKPIGEPDSGDKWKITQEYVHADDYSELIYPNSI